MIFDSHCHLQFAAYDKDREEVIKRVIESNTWLVNIGTNKLTSQKAVVLADSPLEVKDNSSRIESLHLVHFWAAVGLHPIHTQSAYHDVQESKDVLGTESEFDFNFYHQLSLNSKVVAIGETGLDYGDKPDSYPLKAKKIQEKIFKNQIDLANEVKKPLMIHCRNAYEDLFSILKNQMPLAGADIHFFRGSKNTAKKFLNLGFYLSFSGVITFRNAKEYESIIKYIPLERILLETDAPYISPEPFRGQRNEPQRVIFVARKVAQIKNLSEEEVINKTFQNSLNLFKIV